MQTRELAVVLPVYNEQANIGNVVDEWLAELGRLGIAAVLFTVNDGSRDGTAAALRGLEMRHPDALVALEKANAGHGRACRTGYERAVVEDIPWTLQIDSDGQCDPRFFANFWARRAEADCLFGVRTTRDDGPLRALLSAGCRAATSLACGMDLRDANVPYRLVRTAALREALRRIPADFDMQNVALTVVLRRDRALRWVYLPIHFRDRQGGSNSLNVRRILAMGWELLRDLKRIGR
ncbi:MAG: glycosyltransferase family 2 protein [Verrucomicrobiota bacterium]